MSTREILAELPKLNLEDRWAIWQRLSELETEEEITPSPELAAAIEAGLRSAENARLYTVDEVREKIRQWPQRS
jgi:predicted transcriptional regulator